jgi:hypothetical protein
MSRHAIRPIALALLATTTFACATAPRARAAAPTPGPPITIQRAAGAIVLDGDLNDAGWQGITPVTQWFETRVNNSAPAQVGNKAYLAYDDKYLYAGFQFDDPHPELIRAPLGDHDNLNGSTDYGGIILDSNNDGKTARMFLANARGLEYDAISSDVSGEDNSPDWFWDAVGKITPTGWNLELRVPFSSLRYDAKANPTWGLLLYRNYPREQHYQFFSAKLPHDVSCFICNSSKMTGLTTLPHDAHLVLAPFSTVQRSDAPDSLGKPLKGGPLLGRVGFDLKWSPLADLAIDGTVRPDFSQIESDAAQIGTNERFALFYPEKRPFFLEGVDLFATPFQAVYTRTVNSPDGGLRATGKADGTSFTLLATRDAGGGVVILPGPERSGYAFPDFHSDVGILRLRHDLGQSFVSALATDREIDGGAHNRVFGPDFQWRPRPSDAITGQVLWSNSATPNDTNLARVWDGRTLNDRAWVLNASHNTMHNDVFVQAKDLGPNFRADEGFLPQVGYREGYFESGYTLRRPKSLFTRVRFWTIEWYDQEEPTNATLARRVSAGVGMDGKFGSFTRIELNHDAYRTGGVLLSRFQPRVLVQVAPGKLVNYLSLDSYFGQEIDFDNARRGTGLTLIGSLTVLPCPHLELRNDASGRWLNVPTAPSGGPGGRLFNSGVERLRATWMFNARSYLRVIGQYVVTTRDTSLYTFAERRKDALLTSSALFAYKLNWQTVLFAGYGDDRSFNVLDSRLAHSGRQVFLKVSYAWQR